MYSESISQCITWGLGELQKCRLKAVLSPSLGARGGGEDGEVWRCDPGEEVVITQSSYFDLGIEILPYENCKLSLDEFVNNIERHQDYIVLSYFIKVDNEIIQREASKTQKYLRNAEEECLISSKPSYSKTKQGLLIKATTSITVPKQYLQRKVSLVISLSIVFPPSKTPSNFRSDMPIEEQDIKAYLEGGRYRPPKVTPREIELNNVRIIDSLSIKKFSKTIGFWSSVLCLELSNCHPWKTIRIESVDIILERTTKVSCANESSSSNSFSQSQLAARFFLQPVGTNQSLREDFVYAGSQIHICSGHSYVLAYRVVPKCFVNSLNSCPQDFASETGIPPHELSGDFSTPIDIRWTEITSTSDDAPPRSDLSLITHDKISWCLERRSSNDIIIDIEGPSSCMLQDTVTLSFRVTNKSEKTRDLELYIQCPPMSAISAVNESFDFSAMVVENAQIRPNVVCHEVVTPIKHLPPGRTHMFAVSIMPLQTGVIRLNEMFLTDMQSKEIFSLNHAYEIAVQSGVHQPSFDTSSQ